MRSAAGKASDFSSASTASAGPSSERVRGSIAALRWQPIWARCRELLLVLSTQPAASCHTHEPASAGAYERHCPETTLLYRTIQEHWATFLTDLEAGGGELPAFVLDEFEAYLGCGILVHGLLRVRCKDSGQKSPPPGWALMATSVDSHLGAIFLHLEKTPITEIT